MRNMALSMGLDAPAINDCVDIEMAAASNALDDYEVEEGFAASSTTLNRYVVYTFLFWVFPSAS